MTSERTQSVVHLARLIAGAIKRGETVADRLAGACLRCMDGGAPEEFTVLGLSIWRMLMPPRGLISPGLRPDLSALLDRHRVIEDANRRTFVEVARFLGGAAKGGPMPVLLGDAAVLLSFYGTLDAFEASLWVVAVEGTGRRLMRSGTVEVVSASPFDLRVCSAGLLEEPLKRFSRVEEAGGVEWCVPTDELLLVLMAARLGDSRAALLPPMWFHLAVAMLGWRDRVDFDEILELAEDLELVACVHRGLAITAAVFPEIDILVSPRKLDIPRWERLLALPLAARRVVRESMDPPERVEEA